MLRKKYHVATVAMAVLIFVSIIGTTVFLRHRIASADPLNMEEKIETATSSRDVVVRNQALSNLANQADIMRSKWQPWASLHSTMLQNMYSSNGENKNILVNVCTSLPKNPNPGADAGKSGISQDDISSKNGVFTWQPIEENIVTFDTEDPNYKLVAQEFRDRLLSDFSKYHDVVISVSVNSGPERIELWASGRITHNHFESKFVGHHMPFKHEWTVVSEIKPPFDFVTQNHL